YALQLPATVIATLYLHVALPIFRAGTQIMVREVNGGSVRRLPTGPGTNATPAFSPDGQTIVYSHGEESGTDIYALPVRGGSPRRDRKSTRLNSSHVKISYAVFCL